MKKIFSLMLTLVLLSALVPGAGVSARPDGGSPVYPTGLIWECPEVLRAALRDYSLPPAFFSASALPPSVNLKNQFPAPGDQGRQLSCAPWAVAYALRSQMEESKLGWGLHTDEHIFSPAYVYNQINEGADRGSAISHSMWLLINQGAASLASFPYDEFNYWRQPTIEQRGEAAHFRVRGFGFIEGRDNIKRHLADGNGVVITVRVFPDFYALSPSNPIYNDISGAPAGMGHAICLIGYDDNMGENGAFKFINSWGTNWGLGGYGWISYDMLDNPIVSPNGLSFGFIMFARDSSVIYEPPFDYTVSNGKATITRYIDIGLGGDVVIPALLGEHPSTAIADDAFRDSPELTSVVIPNSVNTIGNGAFWGCTGLTSVTIPASVSFIGRNAFHRVAGSGFVAIPLPNLTLRVYENSYAHEYAIENGFPFLIIPRRGDVNGDGVIDSTDVFLLRRWLAATPSGRAAIEGANPNFSIANARVFGGDGEPGHAEAEEIRRWIAAVDKFPLGP
jgi:hypothetical protein